MSTSEPLDLDWTYAVTTYGVGRGNSDTTLLQDRRSGGPSLPPKTLGPNGPSRRTRQGVKELCLTSRRIRRGETRVHLEVRKSLGRTNQVVFLSGVWRKRL